ncbi:hypothetical protein [Archaeoglobus veneficus]|uniref:Uncharacterized protein n=1 Tax=Archaeoglobus veneficus (strain DSM 11195 / SNP6) TaxID=693661 RepID=F2KT37_ARCVS|nr:hypothetical protein [Archaeoglobus veneficus]AEA47067.1 hypothetical protein Arcve_1056 [Archaeoglobus veneficus SNP6]
MRITIDLPPDIEKALMEKCEKAKVSPSDFILSLLDWYFLKRKKDTGNVNEFIRIASQCAAERVKYCKYSDGRHCAREVFSDILEEREPEPIVPYKCLFCPYFVDRRAKKAREIERDLVDRTYDIARLAAKLVVELYGDRLGYRPKLPLEEMEEKEKKISKQEVKRLLDNW